MPARLRFGFALEYVADVEATKGFFVDLLGLDLERFHPSFVEFKDASDVSFAIASDESLSGDRELELYWLVDDAEAAFAELSDRAEISRPLEQLPFGKVFGIKDPAGHPHFLIELSRNRPSQRAR